MVFTIYCLQSDVYFVVVAVAGATRRCCFCCCSRYEWQRVCISCSRSWSDKDDNAAVAVAVAVVDFLLRVPLSGIEFVK